MMRAEKATCSHAGRWLARASVAPAVLLVLLSLGCDSQVHLPSRPQLLVIGIDGGDPEVIGSLVQRGRLPNLQRLVEHGSAISLGTAYSASPVIWTTMVTGVRPEQHGIDDFHQMTENGPIPISSNSRRRPALWNMLERVGRRAAVLGLWATWPAEPTRGLIVSDRLGLGLASEVSPAESQQDLDRWLQAAKVGGIPFLGYGRVVINDRVVTAAAREAVAGGAFDLVFAYLRSVDVTSHTYWHLYEPEAFPAGPHPDIPEPPSDNPVENAYIAVDTAVGQILEFARPDLNVVVVSDHGFFADNSGRPQLLIDTDRILESFGWLVREPSGAIDSLRSRSWAYRSPSYDWTKRVRFSPTLPQNKRASLIAEVRASLSACLYPSGAPVFSPQELSAEDRRDGVEIKLRMLSEGASSSLGCRGREVPGAVAHFARVTGKHGPETRGILLVSGPIFARGKTDADVTIFDLTPTILYALGVPVAADFAGQPALQLFGKEMLESRPVRRIKSWGVRQTGPHAASATDRALMEELAALGYLN